MSLLLYHALTAHPQRLNVLFFSFRFVYTATSKSCCWDYSVLLVFLPRSLAFVRRLFLVRCQTDHKKLEHLLLYNSKQHSSLKHICNYAPLRYACIAELQDPELCWVRQCLVWVWVWDTCRYYCGLKIHYNQNTFIGLEFEFSNSIIFDQRICLNFWKGKNHKSLRGIPTNDLYFRN